MRVTACAALIMVGIWMPSAHALLESLGSAYVLGSVAMLAIAGALVALWPSVVELAVPALPLVGAYCSSLPPVSA